MTVWSFRAPARLHVGPGVRRVLALEAPAWSGSTLVVTSRRGRERLSADPVLGPIVGRLDVRWVDDVQPNPDRAWLEASAARLRAERSRPETVFAFGGGSAIDAAKGLSALLSAPGDARLASVIDDPVVLDRASLPRLVAVATTAGTGSEVTSFATVWDSATRRKSSLASDRLVPSIAVVDAELMDGLPRRVTLAAGLDAINQAAEATWSRCASTIPLELAGVALERGLPALERLIADAGAREARAVMAEASTLAGLAIAQTRTSLCHAMSYPMTAHFGVDHGLACAFTMAAVARHVLAADDGRFERLALRVLGPGADARALPERFGRLVEGSGAADLVRTRVGSLDALLALLPEMVTPGRSDNVMLDADRTVMARILTESWARPGAGTDRG